MNKLHSIIGTSAAALTGYDLNTYFFNGKWLKPVKSYIEADHILPTRVRLNNLPQAAFVVKAYTDGQSGSGGSDKKLLPPKHYQLFFTSDSGPNSTWYTPTLSCYLNFICKNDRYGVNNRPSFTSFASLRQKRHQFSSGSSYTPFDESDADHAMHPVFSFTRCPTFSLNDVHKMQIGVEYLLKLLSISFDLQYDSATTQWLDKGPT